MTFKEALFGFESLIHGLAGKNVLLAAVDDADKTEFQRKHLASQDIQRVRACIHQIQLGHDANRALAHWVHLPRQLETVRVGQIRIGRRHRENNAAKITKTCVNGPLPWTML